MPGTALKPAIEFDSRLKVNVGLTTPVDPRYVLKTTSPSPYFLKENIVTEALVSFLTSLVNFGSLPVAVDYTPQAGKTGPHMAELFQDQDCTSMRVLPEKDAQYTSHYLLSRIHML